MTSNAEAQATLEHHLRAVGSGKLDEIMLDYADESVIHMQTASYHGLQEIRQFFMDFLPNMPPTFDAHFRLKRQVVEREIVYIVWESPPEYLLGTDTYVIRGGKIIAQMFTAYLNAGSS